MYQPKRQTASQASKANPKPLPTLNEAIGGEVKAPKKSEGAEIKEVLKEGLKAQSQSVDGKGTKSALKGIRDETRDLAEAVREGNKENKRDSEDALEETKKGNSLLKKIFMHGKEEAKKAGEEGLENVKDTARGSFGEFGLLAQNAVKTAFTAYTKLKEDDDEDGDKAKRKKAKRSKMERMEDTPPVVVPVPEPAANSPVVNPQPLKPVPKAEAPQPAPATKPTPKPETPQFKTPNFSQVWKSKNPDWKPPTVEKVEPAPKDVPFPTQQKLQAAEGKQFAAMERIWKGKGPQEAPETPTAPSTIDRKGKSPQAVRIERMKRREGLVIEPDAKPAPKAERLSRRERKAQKLEAKRADKLEKVTPEVKQLDNLPEIKESLEKLVELSEKDLKAKQQADLSGNSDSLQTKKAGKDDAPDLANNKEVKKAGGLLDGAIGGFLKGLIGAVGGGGILGAFAGIFKSIGGTVMKLFKPVTGMVKTLAKSGKLIPVIGQIVTVISAVFDFFSGWQDAAKILGKDGELLTLWDKFSAGIGSVLGGFASIIDSILGLFGVETKFEDTVKTGVAKFLSDLPAKIGAMFDSIMKGLDAMTGGFASQYLAALKSFWTSAVKGVLSIIPGGDKIAKAIGLDDKAPAKGQAAPAAKPAATGEVSAAPKPSATFTPRAEANSAAIKAEERRASTPPQAVIAPTNNTQVVNNTNYTSSPLTTRDRGDSHRYGLS